MAEYRGARIYHHTGGLSGFASHMLHLRDEDLTTIVLSNLYLFPFDRVTRGLVRLAKGWPEPAPTLTPLTDEQRQACAGPWNEHAGALLAMGGGPEAFAALNESTLVDPADAEVEYRFSAPRDGRYQRLDYVSPLWPVSVFHALAEEAELGPVG